MKRISYYVIDIIRQAFSLLSVSKWFGVERMVAYAPRH